MGLFSLFWFAVSPNHVKLTVDGKMTERSMWLGGPQEAGHMVKAAHITPTMALTHRTNAAPPAACREAGKPSQ